MARLEKSKGAGCRGGRRKERRGRVSKEREALERICEIIRQENPAGAAHRIESYMDAIKEMKDVAVEADSGIAMIVDVCRALMRGGCMSNKEILKKAVKGKKMPVFFFLPI